MSFLPALRADLDALTATIANSPIAVRRLTLEARLADWENTRKASDVDAVVLAWLASHSHVVARH